MRLYWLLPLVAVACGKQDDGSEGLEQLVGDVKARFSAMLAKIDTAVPDCPSPPPREGPIIMLLPQLHELAEAPKLPEDDPNRMFQPTNYNSHLVGSYTNSYNPKSSKRKYASELLAIQTVVVTKLDKYRAAEVRGDTFVPGLLEGRSVVFEAATSTPKCKVPFTVQNRDKVYAGMSVEAANTALKSDLTSQIESKTPNVKRY